MPRPRQPAADAVGQPERRTQDRVVALLEHGLKYENLGNWQYRTTNNHIEEALLTKYLTRRGYSEALQIAALRELRQTADRAGAKLYDRNKAVYGLLRYGVKVKLGPNTPTKTVWLVDWKQPLENDFGVAEEVTLDTGALRKRPDVVLYVNGLALVMMELKRSTVSVEDGIRQNLDNQEARFVQPFFATVQLVLAGNDSQGLRYGTTGTRAKYYLTWREEGAAEPAGAAETGGPGLVAGAGAAETTEAPAPDAASIQALLNPQATPWRLDAAVQELCGKERLLELLHDFVVFDRGQKKLCRHNQYFGVRAAQAYVRRGEGGIIWHTQGSGKSLTMVWLAKWLRENVTGARVLLLTDRDELDKQIEKVFLGVQETIVRTRSGADLLAQLREAEPWLLCSLIHKFGIQGGDEADYTDFVAAATEAAAGGFQAHGRVFVFVDECHRTQSGVLHRAMRALLPEAVIIGFTGTPLLKTDKETSLEKFGPFIHRYTVDQAVRDKVVLDLRYEARQIDQELTSAARVDQWFEAKTRGLTEYARARLKERWGTMQKVLSSRSRLEKIVADIMLDMNTKERLLNGRGNALLVSGSVYQACLYYELFQQAGLTECAIVTSYKPSSSDLKGESTGEGGLTEQLKKHAVYTAMLAGETPEAFEEEAKRKFVDEPAQMKLLIVVDKLLTGFDAPTATYLYIDKPMRDHGLFQAICRVNRLDDEGKDYGYVVDYKDLFKRLQGVIRSYTTEAFASFDADDVRGLLTDRLEKGREELDQAREVVAVLCEPVPPPRHPTDFQRYFCGDAAIADDLVNTAPRRTNLYKYVGALIRAYAALANDLPEAGYSEVQIGEIQREVRHYEALREEVMKASGDYIDLKNYERDMRHLIDTYIRAEESRVVSALDDISLVELVVAQGPDAAASAMSASVRGGQEAMAEAIANNVRRLIIDENLNNPQHYQQMSELLDQLIAERRAEALSYEAYLAEIATLCRKLKDGEGSGPPRPASMVTNGQKVLYDNLSRDEAKALAADAAILGSRKEGWRGKTIKERDIIHALEPILGTEEEAERLLEIIRNLRADY